MYTRDRTNWIRHIDFIIIDLICLHAAYVAAYYIRFPGETFPYAVQTYRNIIVVISLIQLVLSVMLNSHRDILQRGVYQELVSVIILALFSLAGISLYLYSAHIGEVYSRLLIYYTFIIYAVLDYVCRIIWKRIVISRLRKKAKDKQHARKVFVLTNIAGKAQIIEKLTDDFFESFSIEGVCVIDSDDSEIKLEEVSRQICREWIDEVFIYLPGSTVPDEFVNECTEMGVTIHLVMSLPVATPEKQFVETLGGDTVLTIAYNYMAPHQVAIKRIADIIGGLIGSLFTVIIGLIIGPIIYHESPGPVIFRQKRVGKNGKEFYVYKFRSMYPDADALKQQYMAENRNTDGMMFKMDFDPRVIGNKVLPDGTRKTGIGDFIRRTSLDEFPQFFNVLKGDMSLVGTRPPTVDEWNKYEFHHRARLAVKPGITGMWQVSGRSEITNFEEVVKLDTYYITNFRLSLDIKILFKTVFVLLKRKGAM